MHAARPHLDVGKRIICRSSPLPANRTVSPPAGKWQPVLSMPALASELLLREATPVIIVDTVPALRVAVGTELGVAAVLIAEPFGPTLRVAQRHDLSVGPKGSAMRTAGSA